MALRLETETGFTPDYHPHHDYHWEFVRKTAWGAGRNQRLQNWNTQTISASHKRRLQQRTQTTITLCQFNVDKHTSVRSSPGPIPVPQNLSPTSPTRIPESSFLSPRYRCLISSAVLQQASTTAVCVVFQGYHMLPPPHRGPAK